MDTMSYQITSLTIVNLTIYSGTDQRKHQSSASLPFEREIHWARNFSRKGAVTWRMFPFDDVIMLEYNLKLEQLERLRSEDTPRRPMITLTIDQFILNLKSILLTTIDQFISDPKSKQGESRKIRKFAKNWNFRILL